MSNAPRGRKDSGGGEGVGRGWMGVGVGRLQGAEHKGVGRGRGGGAGRVRDGRPGPEFVYYVNNDAYVTRITAIK